MAEVHPKDMSPEDRETYHLAAEADIERFSYAKPEDNGRPKQIAWLVRRPQMHVVVQCVHEGGENNLHYHTNSETTWLVLKGRAKFEGVDDKELGVLGPMDGIVIPGGSRYKFGKVGAEDLEILQMVAVRDTEQSFGDRVNIEAHREWMADSPELTEY